ncbi:hypothetical protein Tco_1459720 [Tanacetum coccineum]
MSPFDVFDDNQLDTQVNETDEQAQAEPQSNGTSDDINSLAMVVQSNVEPNEEPPTKKLKVMINIPGPIILELYKAYSDNIPIDQFMAQLFGSGRSTTDLSILKRFKTPEEGPMTLEKVALQLQEIKRLVDLNAAKDMTDEALKRMTPA